MYEHGDVITITSIFNQEMLAIVVDKNSSLWSRIKIAYKIIKGI